MRYWWVNQNQTFRQEFEGAYLWSPKQNANGARNPFYESMREVSPGDLILSFVDAKLAAVGIASSYCYESPKPEEFGNAGLNWHAIGWRVRVSFQRLRNTVRPKDHISRLAPFLPDRYSPLQVNGNGNQAVYLTEIPELLFNAIAALIGSEIGHLRQIAAAAPTQDRQLVDADLDIWERHLENTIEVDQSVDPTERESLIMARRGQGIFKQRVMHAERMCRITKVDNPAHLRASHCKPWRDSSNQDRLNGENGLLLTPTIDHLFDRGFISFENSGKLIVSPVADICSLGRMGIPTDGPVNVGPFTDGQKFFLDYHRNSVLLQARRE
jgi:hypothetical protein